MAPALSRPANGSLEHLVPNSTSSKIVTTFHLEFVLEWLFANSSPNLSFWPKEKDGSYVISSLLPFNSL